MNVGLGLPMAIPRTSGREILKWAELGEEGPFASLAVLDRVVYDSYDPLMVLAAVASITSEVRLATTIVVAPLRSSAVLAKQVASLDALSGGRVVLGAAVGAREEDYAAVGVPTAGRGERFTSQLGQILEFWEGDEIGPSEATPSGPTILLGGTSSDKAFMRMVRYGDGFIHGGGPPKVFAGYVQKARAAWQNADRPGTPEIWGQGYFALTDPSAGAAYLRDYYAFVGPFAEKIAEGLLATPQAVAQYVKAYEDAGCDELVLLPATADIANLERLVGVLTELGLSRS